MNAANIYLGIASLIAVFTASLRFFILHFIPGAENIILVMGSLLLFVAIIAAASLLIPSARTSIKTHKVKPMFIYLFSLFFCMLALQGRLLFSHR